MGKFLNLDGLRLFWQKAKAYADGKHEEVTAALKQHTENDHQLLSWQILSLGAGVQKTGAIMNFDGFVDTCQVTLVSSSEIKAAIDAGTAVVLFARDRGLFRLRIPSGESYKYASTWTAYGALYAAADYKAGRMFRDTTTNLYYTWEGSSYAGATPLRLLGDFSETEALKSRITALETRLSSADASIGEIGNYLNQVQCGTPICVLADIDDIDMLHAEDYPEGSFVYDDTRGAVYEVHSDGGDYLFEDVNQWNDRSLNWKARRDVLFFHDGRFFAVNGLDEIDERPDKVPHTPLTLTNHELKAITE